MKLLVSLVILMSASYAQAYNVVGDKIHFQSDSTWVSAYYNKTICHDGETYAAEVNKCLKYRNVRGDQECVEWGKGFIYQPITSTRVICVEERGDSGICQEWQTVEYHQSPTMVVEFYAERGERLIKKETITVPTCN
ncbi:MAG: hypothetical protein HRT45_04015 [Bdellovibrionales bacterium]|nr:hypothetical protein [Bdellovibrionales bacterium]